MCSNGFEMVQLKSHVLKVQINCEGCKRKVKKLLRKIEGVYQVNIDMEEGIIIVNGSLDCATLVKKLKKIGKHAEVVQSESSYVNQNGREMNTWFKDDNNLDLDFRSSMGQNILPPVLENEYGQLGFDNYSNMGINYMRGLPNHNYGPAMNWEDITVNKRGITRGNTNSIRSLEDFNDLTTNFSGFEDQGFPGLQSLYSTTPAYERYPSFMSGNNLHHYHYDNPATLSMSYFDNMHSTDNPVMHDASTNMSLPRRHRMIDPMIHAFPINGGRFY